jgi:hypothetical protein
VRCPADPAYLQVTSTTYDLQVTSTTYDAEITADDIAKGKPFNSRFCPLGLAIKRAIPDAEFASGWFLNDVPLIINFPWSKFIQRFDNGLAVQPVKFTITVP